MKAALVTGAARGIGLATTKLFLAEGWQVAMVDRDGDELAKASEALSNVLPICKDVSISADVEALMAEVGAWADGLDALVNNAGVADFGPIEDTGFERWRRVMETNLDGVFHVDGLLSPYLLSQHYEIHLH